MTHQFIINEETLADIISTCKDYANESINSCDKEMYLNEINNHQNNWSIITTGVFHDAIGELIDWNDSSIYVEDEY